MSQRFPVLLLALSWNVPLFCAGDGVPVVEAVSVTGSHLAVNLNTQVGRPYDKAAVGRDVRYLWELGRFQDIRVETVPRDEGIAVTFRVTEAPRAPLADIRIEPNSYGIDLNIPAGAPVDPRRAQAIAHEASKQLASRGYAHNKVRYDFLPAAHDSVELRLTVDPGASVRVQQVDFTGNLGMNRSEVRGGLRALRYRRILPGIPGLWNGWRLLPSYTTEAADSDAARLRSLYLSKGYFDASVRAEEAEIRGKEARVRFEIEAGPQYLVRTAPDAAPAPFDSKAMCGTLLADRRAAQRQGVMDFSATLNIQPRGQESGGDAVADLTTAIDRGRPYRLGRLDIFGNRHFTDAAVRRMFLLDEGDPLDELKLRQSLARLNRTSLFDPIGPESISLRSDAKSGVANVTVRLTERKRGSWNISGPVGPASIGGPLEGFVSTRLPALGRSFFELSTYTVSVGAMAFYQAIIPVPGAPKNGITPVVALRRGALPGQGWLSGFAISPEVGWQFTALSYAMGQLQQRVGPLLEGNRSVIPELPVKVDTPGGDGVMMCEPPAPRLWPLRKSASVVLSVAGALTTF